MQTLETHPITRIPFSLYAGAHKVHIYNIPRVPQCSLVGIGPPPHPPQPLSHKRVCPSHWNQQGWGTYSPADEGVGESQFGRLEKRPIALCLYTDKKENKIFLIYKEIQKWSSCKVIYDYNGLLMYGKYLRISSYIRKPSFLIYMTLQLLHF
jgi:hypothetical protein